MTIDGNQLNPRRKVPFSVQEFDWRSEIIKTHTPDVVVRYTYPVYEGDVGIITWDRKRFTWPEFLKAFARFCDEHGEVPF